MRSRSSERARPGQQRLESWRAKPFESMTSAERDEWIVEHEQARKRHAEGGTQRQLALAAAESRMQKEKARGIQTKNQHPLKQQHTATLPAELLSEEDKQLALAVELSLLSERLAASCISADGEDALLARALHAEEQRLHAQSRSDEKLARQLAEGLYE